MDDVGGNSVVTVINDNVPTTDFFPNRRMHLVATYSAVFIVGQMQGKSNANPFTTVAVYNA